MMTQPFDDIDMGDAIEWLTKHTHFPTFDEFKKNPDKWRLRPEEIFESIDASSVSMRKAVQGQKYFWKNLYECNSLEQLDRIAKEEGFSPDQLEMKPIARPLHGTSADNGLEIIVEVWPKN